MNASLDPGRGVSLDELVTAALPGAHLHARGGVGAVHVRDVTHDSRLAGPGVLFAARRGLRSDGHDYAAQAVAAGAPALLVERVLPLDAPQVQVPDVATALGPVAAQVHGDPSAELLMLGVTGTNGKTTSTYLLEGILRAAGHTTGLIGTIQTLVAGRAAPGVRTTPESTDLQRLLRHMRQRGVTAVALEVSSHGLALHRIDGTRIDVAGFTNLTQDHLDFHRDLEDYYAAKARLFDGTLASTGVVNVDDPWGRRLAQEAVIPMTTVSPTGQGADVRAVDVTAGRQGSRYRAEWDSGVIEVRTPLPGPFNVANTLLALTMALRAGIDAATAAEAVRALHGVPGRMERVDAGQPFMVLVDYAHTPDSVEHALHAARDLARADPDHAPGRVIVVLGCGGERDRAKRPLMGRAAVAGSDLAVLTSDNPRGEAPEAIIEEMVGGARGAAHGSWITEIDRRAAIAHALGAAEPHDVVVIAGKGHETYQELADRTIDFDDRAVAREILTGQQERPS